MFRFKFLLTLIFFALPLYAQQPCDMPDSSYWACADSGRLCRVCPESTVTVQTTAKNFTFTAIHFEPTQGKYGWAGGNDSLGHVILMRTIDYGKNWMPTLTPVFPKGDGVDRIHFVKSGLVFVLFKSGKALRSCDWGCTYDRMMSPVAGTSYEQGKKLFEETIRHFEGNTK